MDTTPKIVSQNPYRILGVYANSPKRDIVANKGKASAFLKVNKPVEYPLDLKGILPAPKRTLDLMNEAESHLAIAKEQIKYAQFWFLQKMSPLDGVAFNHLLAGNMAEAIEIWSKQESLSSLQNKLVCHLIEGKHKLAVEAAEKLYEKFGDDYISKVDANCTLQMTGKELLYQFIDSLGEEIGMQTMLSFALGGDTKAYISNQAIGPLVNKISAEVSRAKSVDHKDPNARKNAGLDLIRTTKEPLKQLKSILPVNDPQYVMIADKLGQEILQCGIDYFNNSEDDDAPYTAMKLQKYALSVVVGSLAKQRCEENVKILQNIIDNLPPREVLAEDKAIKKELSKFVKLPDKIIYSVALINGTKGHLQSIKQKLGNTNEYYLKKSTQVVSNALHNIIEEVNEAQQPLAALGELLAKMDPMMRNIFLSGDNDVASKFREIERNVKSTLREAWKATVLMDDFDMEDSFKSRYRENRNTLKSLCDNMGISTYVSKPSTPRPISSSAPHTSSSRTTTQSRSSTAYNPVPPKTPNKEMNPIIAVVIIHVIWGLFGLSDGIGGFFGAMFAGIVGWIIPINFAAYAAIEWIYKQMNE